VIDEGLAKELGITATRGNEVVLVDGSVDKVGVSSAQVEIQGIVQTVPIYT
jgi:predicted aspartyl protease